MRDSLIVTHLSDFQSLRAVFQPFKLARFDDEANLFSWTLSSDNSYRSCLRDDALLYIQQQQILSNADADGDADADSAAADAN